MTLIVITSPECTTVSVASGAPVLKVSVTAEPLGIPLGTMLEVTPQPVPVLATIIVDGLLVLVQVKVQSFAAELNIMLPLKPELNDMPVIDTEPKSIEAAPTFRTTTFISQVAAPATKQFVDEEGLARNVADSMIILDRAAWFFAPSCEPVDSEVGLKNP